jgi:hypothetical protein
MGNPVLRELSDRLTASPVICVNINAASGFLQHNILAGWDARYAIRDIGTVHARRGAGLSLNLSVSARSMLTRAVFSIYKKITSLRSPKY